MPDTNVVPITPEEKEELTFDDFWLVWPKERRVCKMDARTAWNRLSHNTRVDAMTALLQWANVWAARAEWQYVPHPHRWIQKERWTDELPPEYKPRAVSVATAAFKADMDKALAERTPMPESLRVKLGMKGAR